MTAKRQRKEGPVIKMKRLEPVVSISKQDLEIMRLEALVEHLQWFKDNFDPYEEGDRGDGSRDTCRYCAAHTEDPHNEDCAYVAHGGV